MPRQRIGGVILLYDNDLELANAEITNSRYGTGREGLEEQKKPRPEGRDELEKLIRLGCLQDGLSENGDNRLR